MFALPEVSPALFAEHQVRRRCRYTFCFLFVFCVAAGGVLDVVIPRIGGWGKFVGALIYFRHRRRRVAS